MGGNPIGPYGDISENYNNVMTTNKEAVKNLLKYAAVLDKISESCKDTFSKIENSGPKTMMKNIIRKWKWWNIFMMSLQKEQHCLKKMMKNLI